ncbi:type I restriction enzyme HsdR N-terminal domain-containing protein [Agrobacterium fabrum]|uniref:type I restriction enzyme HsdR N-terminal domain-containing protein n=1 Tax=Agrobacterium fabrum TaxID=1176649 RepID=UPI0015736DB8|nr:type I restriction enzyme HsdR N-terminal domain-containing protein [Agrobacterium fabrum]WIE30872.1 type I restriction enzyme HsdR N-terminal domain-containing protein [Agrobacterium fabrum]WIE46819.1 type I restriction enzyme HsdR N-terminal domain-containing protein [Agrobacterium fabrum]
MIADFWNNDHTLPEALEADVETWFVLPLLEALGHDRANVASKVPIRTRIGHNQRPGRKPEADFVIYAEAPFGASTSLAVIETKRTSEPLNDDAREQAESYSRIFLAPVVLLTNGRQLQIWQLQPTAESTCVFRCDVQSLTQHRAEVEDLLSVEALKHNCSVLQSKRFDLAARDLGEYERNLFDKNTELATSSVARALLHAASDQPVQSGDLLRDFPRGAIITGPSAYGKTRLGAMLLVKAVEERWADLNAKLPFDVFLPDLAMSNKALDAFLAENVSAAKPGYSVASLERDARESGLIIVADGFERMPVDDRQRMEAMLRVFLQRFPKIQLFLLSRFAPANPAEMPLLKLQGYQPVQLNALTKLRAISLPGIGHAFQQAPDHITRMAEVPQIADMILEQYSADGRYTNSIAELYERWLDRLLSAQTHVVRALDRRYLAGLADATRAGPIGIDAALAIAPSPADAQAALERLGDNGALNVRGSTIELTHEGLADYLRALHVWEKDRSSGSSDDDLIAAADPASLFPVLLVATAINAQARSRAWRAIARKDLRAAIRSLRLAAGGPFDDQAASFDEAHQFFVDMKETMTILTEAHFMPITQLLMAEIAGAPVSELAIIGWIAGGYVGYGFLDRRDAVMPIEIGNRDDRMIRRVHGHSLKHFGYGIEGGRILGMRHVRDALYKLIANRMLAGGPVWTEELVFGRLRHLERSLNLQVSGSNLLLAYDILMNHRHKVVTTGGFTNAQPFAISDLLHDIHNTLDRGVSALEQWWPNTGRLDLTVPDDQASLATALDTYFRRVQLAYGEVVDLNFLNLKPFLPNAAVLPLRFEVEATSSTHEGWSHIGIQHRRWPVATVEQAGAAVSFPATASNFHCSEAIDDYAARTSALLEKLKRPGMGRISWGSSILPDFDGHVPDHGGLPDESVIVAEAMSWLKDDFDELFSETNFGV